MLSPVESLQRIIEPRGVVLGIPDSWELSVKGSHAAEGECDWSHMSDRDEVRQEGLDHLKPCLDFILNGVGSHWRLVDRKEDQSGCC